MSLLSLPNELLLQVGEDFLQPRDLSSFIHANRRLAHLLTPRLHRFAIQDKNGTNALQWAARQGHEGLIELLLKKGFNIDFQGPMGMTGTALYRAVGAGREGSVQLLLASGANINLPDAWGYTALHVSVTRKSEWIIHKLLECGADHTVTATDGKTALHLAASDKQQAAVRLLLQKGADPNVIDSVGATPLHLAISDHKPPSYAVISLLLESGADVAKRGYGGRTALYLAARSGIEAVVELVLKYWCGTSVRFDMLDMNGMTALHVAASLGNAAVVRRLLEVEGADVVFNLTNEDLHQRTALDLAVMVAYPHRPSRTWDGGPGPVLAGHNYKPAIELLMYKCGLGIYKAKTLNQVIFWAVGEGHDDIFYFLLENGADISAHHPPIPRGRAGDTLLHAAAEFGRESLVRFLLEKGADVNATNARGKTPLHLYYERRSFKRDAEREEILRMLGEKTEVFVE